MNFKSVRLVLAVAALAVVIFLGQLWRPARQVRLHQQHLLRAVEKRDWQAVRRFIDAEYRDRWGHHKENVIANAAQVFAQFIACGIQAQEQALALGDGTATVSTTLTLTGTGGPFAEMAKSRVNALTEPFTFKWVKRSAKPWDWALVEAGQPEIEVGEIPSL